MSNMASRKKSDGGAARAAGRQRVQNKRTEAKYGLQGFTAQANKNLQTSIVPSKAEQATLLLGGVGNVAGKAGGLGKALKNEVLTKPAAKIANQVGDAAFDIAVGSIKRGPVNLGGVIKNTKSTIYTPAGSFSGKGSFLVTPTRTLSQAAGIIRGQITKAEKEANKIASAANVAAKMGIKKGLKVGGAAAGAVGSLFGYQVGKSEGARNAQPSVTPPRSTGRSTGRSSAQRGGVTPPKPAAFVPRKETPRGIDVGRQVRGVVRPKPPASPQKRSVRPSGGRPSRPGL